MDGMGKISKDYNRSMLHSGLLEKQFFQVVLNLHKNIVICNAGKSSLLCSLAHPFANKGLLFGKYEVGKS